ncbi:MAG: hypothetical protein E7646_09265 [Ruminococcaceae bacterium]|nr:hypothetical protein [Oscillospiraceae bacterium]
MKRILSAVLLFVLVFTSCSYVYAEDFTPDVSWYDESKSEFVIDSAAKLLGFAELSKTNDFKGKTIKLAKDITLNSSDASSWAQTPPELVWSPVKDFGGTFDGCGFTISGVYAKGSAGVGFFHYVIPGSVIKNFRLENSYFEGPDGMNGSVIACSGGSTVSNVYSNAIVVSNSYHTGGIVGVCDPETTLVVDNCWFDGSVTMGARFGGGIVGNGNGARITVTNCLNTGSVYSSFKDDATTNLGGIVGRNDNTTIIENCLNTGKISTAYQESGKDDVIGSIFGACWANYKTDDNKAWKSHISIKNSYATAESCKLALGSNHSSDPSQIKDYTVLNENMLKSYSAYLNTKLDFENTYAVNIDGFPVLKLFAEVVPPLYKLAAPYVSKFEAKAEGFYGPRWYISLDLDGQVKKEDITIGALIVPTKAIPENYTVSLDDDSFSYRGKDYKVANVEAKILRESTDKKLVASFVVTDLSSVDATTSFTVVPYVIYKVEDGKAEIPMYGEKASGSFYKEAALTAQDPSTDASYKAQLEKVLAPMDKDYGGRLPVHENWSELDLFEGLPAFIGEQSTIGSAEDRGAGNRVITVDGTTDDDYKAYLAQLEKFGFKKHSDNGEKGIDDAVYASTFTKGDLVVTVTHMSYWFQTAISATFDLPLSEHLFDNFKDDVADGASTTLHMNELWYYGTSVLIQLKNGHFIMNDGSTDHELGYLLDYMEELTPAGEKPVIEAWFMSHLHYDHSYIITAFLNNPTWADRIIVEGFYFSEPSNAAKDLDKGVYSEIAKEYEAIKLLKDSNGKTPLVYRPQTGQRYYFSDIYVDVMLSQENIDMKEYQDGFNETSIWLEYNIDGQNVVIGGDSGKAGMDMMMRLYEPSTLTFDVYFVLHHGSNVTQEWIDAMTCTTVMHPYHYFDTASALNVALTEKAFKAGGEYLVEGDGTVVLTFPYKVGEFKRLSHNTWKYHQGQKRVWD